MRVRRNKATVIAQAVVHESWVEPHVWTTDCDSCKQIYAVGQPHWCAGRGIVPCAYSFAWRQQP